MALIQDRITELYMIAFNRAPEKSGIDAWVSKMKKENLKIHQVMDKMLKTSAAKELYGSKFDNNEDFINEIYKNALGKDKTTDPEGVKAWAGFLDKGMSRGETVVKLIETAKSDEAKKADATAAKIFENKAEVSKYMASKFNYVPKKEDGKFNFEIFQKPLADMGTDNLDEIKKQIDDLAQTLDTDSGSIDKSSSPKGENIVKASVKLYDGILIGRGDGLTSLSSIVKAGDTVYTSLKFIFGSSDLDDSVVYKDKGIYIKKISDFSFDTDKSSPIAIWKEDAANLPSVNNLDLHPVEVKDVRGDMVFLKGNLNISFKPGFKLNADKLNEDIFVLHSGIEADEENDNITKIVKNLANKFGNNKHNDYSIAQDVVGEHMYSLIDNDLSHSLSSGDIVIKMAGITADSAPETAHFIEIL